MIIRFYYIRKNLDYRAFGGLFFNLHFWSLKKICCIDDIDFDLGNGNVKRIRGGKVCNTIAI